MGVGGITVRVGLAWERGEGRGERGEGRRGEGRRGEGREE
jgi:hypothetical protein